MILLVSTPGLRLDMIRDLKGGGYRATAPKEDQRRNAYTLYVDKVPLDEESRVLEIARGVDPSVKQLLAD